jgi:CHAT domain
VGNGVDTPAALTVVARCWDAVDAVAAGAVQPHDVRPFLADLDTLPGDHPQRGELAATMLTLLTKGGGAPSLGVIGELGALLDMVDTAPPRLLAWPRVRASARAFQLVHEVQHQDTTATAAAAELDELVAGQSDYLPTRLAIEAARRAVRLSSALQRDDKSSAMGTLEELKQMAGSVGDVPHSGPLRDAYAMLQELFQASRGNDWGAARDLLGRVRGHAAAMGMDPDAFVEPEHESLVDLLSDSLPDTSGLTTDEIVQKYAGDNTGAFGKLLTSHVLLRGGEETDLDRIDRGLELVREVAAEPGPTQDLARSGIAVHLWRRAEVLGTTEGLDEAQRVLSDLIADLRGRGGSAHPLWTAVHELLAQIKRRVGDQGGSGAAGREAMFRFAHQALVESDPAAARTGLREAAALGMEFARARMIAEDYAGAMDTLDTSRGLMLFAEVELLDLVPRLRAAGRDDLVRRWEVEGPAAPGLRAEAVEVLVSAAGGIDKLLKPPSPADVRAALGAVHADALVYLVPADHQQLGMALVVPREGPLAYLPLSHLSVRQEAGVEGYLAALSHLSRDLAPSAQAHFVDRLDELCEWAWRVAIGPLLERYFARDADRRGRVPRIVLIPMAELAAIPWQAARSHDGTYALELAAFSQAVSAREFCANAARSPVRLTSTGLVVGDPHTDGAAKDLPAARLEAFEIHKAFLRAAKYVGRRPNGTQSPSGPGTAQQVRAWLTAEGPGAGAVLHLACHGQFTSDEQSAKACLLLAPDSAGNPGELGADEIVRLLHSTPNRRIGLVVMAACHTGRSIHGYDEAYSLGTVFLAGGVRTVLSTQWAVPDEATTMLMYLFHHYLRTEEMLPWQALRAAQLRMLRPDTPMPDTMPAHLRELLSCREHPGVVGWAGFVHGGH